MASDGYHEPISDLDVGVIDRHRAIRSVMEEFEAVDWYDQRVAATSDPTLAAMLAHNRDEEKEHAAMGIEWLRRNDATFDEQLRTYLFTDGPITLVEASAMGDGEADAAGEPDPAGAPPADERPAAPHGTDGSLAIGSLKDDTPPEGSP